MFINLFRKKNGDYYRYWASVSTKGYDYKKKKQTDEYINATIPVRLIPDVEDDLAYNEWAKTKNKAIQRIRLEKVDGFFEAVEPNEGDPFVRYVIIECEVQTDDEDAEEENMKPKKSKKDD